MMWEIFIHCLDYSWIIYVFINPEIEGSFWVYPVMYLNTTKHTGLHGKKTTWAESLNEETRCLSQIIQCCHTEANAELVQGFE